MALSEQEELELLTLEREKAMGGARPQQEGGPNPAAMDAFVKYMQLTNPFALAGKGAEVLGQQLDKAAYNIGGAATDAAAKFLPATRTNPVQYMIPTAPEVGMVANIATQAAPTVLGGEAGKLASPAVQSFARRLVQSAIKPNRDLLGPGRPAERAITTILEKDIPTSEAGMAATSAKSKAIDERVGELIGGSNERVNTQDTARGLIEEIKALNNVSMSGDKRNKLTAKLEEYLAENPENMSVQRAHELKRGNYAEVGNRPFMATQDAATALEDQARMAVAKGQREATIRAVPATEPLLKEQSDLRNVLTVAGPKLMMEANRNPVSFGVFSPSWERLLGWMIDRDAATKGLIARNLYKGSERIPQTLAQLMAAAGMGYNNYPGPALSPESGGALYSDYEPPQRGIPLAMRAGGSR